MFRSLSKLALARIGVSASRVIPAERTLASQVSNTKGWLIELVGPAGIGKTTLYEKVEPDLKQDWFSESHAKGLVGHTTVDKAAEDYLEYLFVNRLKRVQGQNLRLDQMAQVSHRVCEIARFGLVVKSAEIPRGFVLHDGVAHFFAEQILEQDIDASRRFFERTAFIFLMPATRDEIITNDGKSIPYWDVYENLRNFFHELGRPILSLSRNDDNRSRILSFIKNDVLREDAQKSGWGGCDMG